MKMNMVVPLEVGIAERTVAWIFRDWNESEGLALRRVDRYASGRDVQIPLGVDSHAIRAARQLRD